MVHDWIDVNSKFLKFRKCNSKAKKYWICSTICLTLNCNLYNSGNVFQQATTIQNGPQYDPH
jgi:hypothetical protein